MSTPLYIRFLEWTRVRRMEIVFAGIIVFTALISFGMGYLASMESDRAPIVIEQCDTTGFTGGL